MVLRTVYLPPDVDEALRGKAYAERASKGELIRRFVSEGLQQDELKPQAEEALREAYQQSGRTIQRDADVDAASTAVAAMVAALGASTAALGTPTAVVAQIGLKAAALNAAAMMLGVAPRERETKTKMSAERPDEAAEPNFGWESVGEVEEPESTRSPGGVAESG